jgi:polysaccharide transporter, PST family
MALKSESPTKCIWRGAFVLTIAALVTKILSAVYRIPYQNIAGDIGFYIYQQVYPFYGIVVALATYGYPVVISKMIAERDAEQDDEGITYILKISLYFLLIMGMIGFSILYIGAGRIARFMGDKELALLIQIISFSFLLFPFISILRGYFQGKNNMVPTAVSQIAEQFVRVVTILLSTYVLLKSGRTVYEAGAGATFGSLTGGFFALLLLTAYWLKKGTKQKGKIIKKTNIDAKKIISVLLVQGFTICVTNTMLILIQFIDALSLFSLLVSTGIEEQAAKALKGIYDRGQPLIQLGTVIATAFSLTLVPLISGAKQRGDEQFIREKVCLSFRIGVVVGLGAAVGLACIIKPTNIMLFKDDSGAFELAILSGSILFTSLALTMAAILQGIGREWTPVFAVLIGISMKWMLNVWLVPVYQTAGAALATLISYMTISAFLYYILRKKIKMNLIRKNVAFRIITASVAMLLILQLYLWASNKLGLYWKEARLFASLQALAGVIIGGCFYIITVLRGRVFSKQELSLLPLGEKLIKFLSKDDR